MTLIDRSFRERILLVGVAFRSSDREVVVEHLDELAALVDTAGAEVVDRVIQVRDRPDPATFVGSGKAAEIHERSLTYDVDTVVFDEELSPGQQRNLERILGRTAIDRTAVILDVFAQNARSQEGKAQVELALLRYRLPRLVGRSHGFSQQVGRIGTRGPGETKLEEDRRRIQDRISALRRELRTLDQQRRLQRTSRTRARSAQVAVVGYTNVGKSSLLHALTGADVVIEDRLFATLDPRTRRLALPGGETIILTDTVGFIRKLPHQLVEAFRSTLEVVTEADLLVHVVDASSPNAHNQMREVRTVLAEIGAGAIPELVVYNKVDRLPPGSLDSSAVLAVSAVTGFGLDALIARIGEEVRTTMTLVALEVPSDRGDVLALIHREGEVIEEEYRDGRVMVRARVDTAAAELIRRSLSEPSIDALE
ncbi:MAG: GTPase HflX [Ferrimicrobium sp.]